MAEQAVELPGGPEAQTAQGETGDNRRHISNILVRPKYSVRFIHFFLVGGLATIGIVIGFVYMRLMDIDDLLNSAQAMGVGGHIPVYDAFTDVTTIAIAGLTLFVIYSCVIAILLSHRVAGPMTALIDCIDQIKKGNYRYERDLRRGDELRPIHDAIRDLARALKEKEQKAMGQPGTGEGG